MMKLLYSPVSPFARKARVLLSELAPAAPEVELIEVSSTPTAPAPELAATHALKKIPVLVRANGGPLYDSRVITRYLDAGAKGGFYPEPDDPKLWETLTLEATGDGIMDAAVIMVYERRCRPEDKQDRDWLDAQWGKIENALDALTERWIDHLAGPLDAGVISTACALGYLDLRHSDRGWRSGRGALDDWFAAFSQRASMRETAPA